MKVTVNLKDGTSETHDEAIIIGEVRKRSELIVGNRFDLLRFPLADVLDFKGTVDTGEETPTVDDVMRILHRL